MNVHQRLLNVRKSVSSIYKANKNDSMGFNYASSTDVLKAVRDEINNQGLLLIPQIVHVDSDRFETISKTKYGDKQNVNFFTELTMNFIWVNVDEPTDRIECKWYGQGLDIMGEKGVGKALTYAEKYFILKFFNLPTDNDDPDAMKKPDDQILVTGEIFSEKMFNEKLKQCVFSQDVKDLYAMYSKEIIASSPDLRARINKSMEYTYNSLVMMEASNAKVEVLKAK